jgi:hypothetical protein
VRLLCLNREQLMRGSRLCEITMLKSSSDGLIMPYAKYCV